MSYAGLQHFRVNLRPTPSRNERARIKAKNNGILKCQAQSALELDALIPSVLDHAFGGEL
jgi:hypothetical protein